MRGRGPQSIEAKTATNNGTVHHGRGLSVILKVKDDSRGRSQGRWRRGQCIVPGRMLAIARGHCHSYDQLVRPPCDTARRRQGPFIGKVRSTTLGGQRNTCSAQGCAFSSFPFITSLISLSSSVHADIPHDKLGVCGAGSVAATVTITITITVTITVAVTATAPGIVDVV